MTELEPGQMPQAGDPLGLKPGEIFWNNYRVLNIIGKGGVSTVYKAENQQNKQLVAIKLLHAQKTRDQELVRRFIREAQTTTRLDHPHAIHIFEWGIDNNERPFMIIEYLAGETLAKRIQKSNGLNCNKALEIMEQICAAIQEAHSLGIIHRDLKPDNIMLTTYQGVANWVKVCDFGIARLETEGSQEGGVAQAPLTQTGAILGTPMYMSPEQLRGRKADQRSDIYSLGCIMYEMLTGKPPFASRNTADIVVGHLNLTPEMPHRVRLDLNIPEELSAATMRALAKNPWERPTTVQEFISALSKSIEKKADEKPVLKQPTAQAVKQAPYGIVDPVRRVCPRCKAVAAGGNFKYCLKCGQDNMGKWLPYHRQDRAGSGNLPALFCHPANRRIFLWITLGIIICWCSYAYLSSPYVLTGHFTGKLDHRLFAASAITPRGLGRQLKISSIDMVLSENNGTVHGIIKTAYGEDEINGQVNGSNPMFVLYDLNGNIDKAQGRLKLSIAGTFNKIVHSYTWTVKAAFHANKKKLFVDSARMTISAAQD